jgi:hypothetical protein
MTTLLIVLLILTSVWAISATAYAHQQKTALRELIRSSISKHYEDIDNLKIFSKRYRSFVISIDLSIAKHRQYIKKLQEYGKE